MPSNSIRPPPPSLSIFVPSTHVRSASSGPAFGKIPTYSYRVPRTRSRTAPEGEPQRRDGGRSGDSSEEESGGVDEIAKIASAQVGKRVVSRDHTPVHVISFRVHPPTPSQGRSVEDPVLVRASLRAGRPERGGGQDRAAEELSVKQQRRSASIYSVALNPRQDAVGTNLPYLRPSSVSLSHVNLSQESLGTVAGQPCPSLSSSCETSSSRTVRPRPPAPNSNTAPNDRAHLSSDQIALPTSSSPIHLPSQSQSTRMPLPADQTVAAERLKRLYLCPWESNEPRIAGKPIRGQHTSIDFAVGRPNAACVDVGKGSRHKKQWAPSMLSGDHGAELGQVDAIDEKFRGLAEVDSKEAASLTTSERADGRHHDRPISYFVKLAIVTALGLALMIDLVVLNVKVLSTEDWE